VHYPVEGAGERRRGPGAHRGRERRQAALRGGHQVGFCGLFLLCLLILVSHDVWLCIISKLYRFLLVYPYRSDPSLFANLLRFFFFSELLAVHNEQQEGEDELDTAASRLQQILSIFFQVSGGLDVFLINFVC
jgi:hypothetical protein